MASYFHDLLLSKSYYGYDIMIRSYSSMVSWRYDDIWTRDAMVWWWEGWKQAQPKLLSKRRRISLIVLSMPVSGENSEGWGGGCLGVWGVEAEGAYMGLKGDISCCLLGGFKLFWQGKGWSIFGHMVMGDKYRQVGHPQKLLILLIQTLFVRLWEKGEW